MSETTELESILCTPHLRTHLRTLCVCHAVAQCVGAAVECFDLLG